MPEENGDRPAAHLRLIDAAAGDLADNWAYLAREANEATATRPIEAIQSRFDQVSAFPHSGVAGEQLALHGARDAAALAEDSGFA